MNAKIVEIFRSIQGEGPYAGEMQVFIRFFECNMHCTWCDTPQSIGDGKREYLTYSAQELWQTIKPLTHNAATVSVTGGEPLIQAEFLKEFLPIVRRHKLKVYLDTNGTLPGGLKKILPLVDTIAMDFKLSSSTKERSYLAEHEAFAKIAKRKELFVKIVTTKQTQWADFKKALEIIKKTAPKTWVYIQPNYNELKTGVIDHCLGLYEKAVDVYPRVKLFPQVHKIMGIQ